MNLVKAEAKDFKRIREHYECIIDNTEDMDKYARWKKGLHPSDSGIKKYIDEGTMYMLMDGGCIAGTMAVTMKQDDEYRRICWNNDLEDSDTAVIHILGVAPEYQKKGIGSMMIDEAVRLARYSNKKAVRLDALASNTPARHMYETKGFEYRGKLKLYADNTGLTDFCFYEYQL